jgi:hypothetical protein
VIVMMRSGFPSPLGSEFDDFLFAPIGEDNNGMPLSVVSALARLDVDPWVEASKLARLPGKASVLELATLIAALPDGPSARPDPGTTAARLVALLPCPPSSDVWARKRLPGVDSVFHSPVVRYRIFYVIFILLMLLSQWLAASRQVPAPAVTDPATASGAISPSTPPTSATH